jgi:hypothetical protein
MRNNKTTQHQHCWQQAPGPLALGRSQGRGFSPPHSCSTPLSHEETIKATPTHQHCWQQAPGPPLGRSQRGQGSATHASCKQHTTHMRTMRGNTNTPTLLATSLGPLALGRSQQGTGFSLPHLSCSASHMRNSKATPTHQLLATNSGPLALGRRGRGSAATLAQHTTHMRNNEATPTHQHCWQQAPGPASSGSRSAGTGFVLTLAAALTGNNKAT